MSAALLIAAETSKTVFYLFAGAFAAWAIVLAALGLTRDGFPGGESGGRGVMALSALLAVGAVAAAVATASTPEHVGKAELKPVSGAEAEQAGLNATQAPTKEQVGGGGEAAPTGTVKITAAQGLAFKQKSLSAKAGKGGKVTIDFDNPNPIPHNVQVEDAAGKHLGGTKTISSSKATATVDAKPGSYTFYCSVAGHRQAGMEGKLTVK
jgi:plastocyanin